MVGRLIVVMAEGASAIVHDIVSHEFVEGRHALSKSHPCDEQALGDLHATPDPIMPRDFITSISQGIINTLNVVFSDSFFSDFINLLS